MTILPGPGASLHRQRTDVHASRRAPSTSRTKLHQSHSDKSVTVIGAPAGARRAERPRRSNSRSDYPKPIVNKASAVWNGDLFSGSGTTSLNSSNLGTFDVSWKARAEESGATTTPEELIASAHATCYAMQLSNELAENQTPTNAEVTFAAGTGITGIHLSVSAQVEGLTSEDFARIADSAKTNCPVSQALAATDITLAASLA